MSSVIARSGKVLSDQPSSLLRNNQAPTSEPIGPFPTGAHKSFTIVLAHAGIATEDGAARILGEIGDRAVDPRHRGTEFGDQRGNVPETAAGEIGEAGR